MRPLRLMLACLLSLGISIQGYASTRAMEADCPMMQAAASHEMHMAADEHDMAGMSEDHGHSSDPVPAEDNAGHCACAMGCQPANSISLGIAAMPVAVPLLRQAMPQLAAAFRSHTVFRHWRPPALI